MTHRMRRKDEDCGRPDGHKGWCRSRASMDRHNQRSNASEYHKNWYVNLRGPAYSVLLLRNRRNKALARRRARA